jgi:hypothetical protein
MTAPSPALPETLPAKHRTVLAREGSRNWEDGGVRDGGVERNESEQVKDARQASKHGPSAPSGAGWASGWPNSSNQSLPTCRLANACHLDEHQHAEPHAGVRWKIFYMKPNHFYEVPAVLVSSGRPPGAAAAQHRTPTGIVGARRPPSR